MNENLKKSLVIIMVSLLVGCAQITGSGSTSDPDPNTMTDTDTGTGRTDEEQAAWEQCLRDNMAVAIAWEIIEQQCAASVSPQSDPLDMR